MTVRFGNYRLTFYIGVFVLSGVVLGLAANFASIFYPKVHHDFIIFAILTPSLTIFIFLLTLQWSQPQTEAIALGVLCIFWLTMGAWATDIIGITQCDALRGQTTPANAGETNAQSFCYEMKVIQAFSWAIFIGVIYALYILFQLVGQAQRFGRYYIWTEPIRELPWFGEMPGYYNTGTPYPPNYGYDGYPDLRDLQMRQGPLGPPGPPGHSIVIHQNPNGPPVVTQT